MSISQEMRYRDSVLRYAERYGVKKAAAKFNEPDKTIYRWRKRWLTSDKDIYSLANGSRRPKNHSHRHTDTEIRLVQNLRRRNPNIGLQDLWLKARNRGYTRSMSGLAKLLKRLGCPTKQKTTPSPTCKQKPIYNDPKAPGGCIQIDVKEVPTECLDEMLKEHYGVYKLYQYTAIDVYSRLRIIEGYLEQNTYISKCFLLSALSFYKSHGIEVKTVQTDNGTVFTNRFLTTNTDKLTLFEQALKERHIHYKTIKTYTPKHNGKVERSHREDQRRFYSEILRLKHLITDMNDFRKRLKAHQKRSNNRGMRPLAYLSPLEFLKIYFWLHGK